jgi:coenzyme PQQ synthesis protein D (PqqD)
MRGSSGVTVEPNPDVVFRRLGERMVLVHLKTNEIFELNETSARFWELIAEDGDVASVEQRLAQEFDVDPAQLHHEVAATLSFLSSQRLITGHDDG